MATTDGDQAAFTLALAKRISDSGRSMTWLAVEVGRQQDRPEPYSQAHLSDWKSGRRTPNPSQVFALERALGAPPGALSRLLGYLPADAVASVTVEDAIAADPTLTARHRDALLAMYRALSDPGKEG